MTSHCIGVELTIAFSESHNLTDLCWKKCFASSTIKSGALDKGEETCLANCVGRFLDLNVATLKHVQNMRQS
jgi:mitochondrial import inner membrane translocase subunit TIM8